MSDQEEKDKWDQDKAHKELIEWLKSTPPVFNFAMYGEWGTTPEIISPERDEQSTFYGYKVLIISPLSRWLVSPVYPAEWVQGQLVADREPTDVNRHGIYFLKREDDPELVRLGRAYHNSVLVRCAVYGTVIETERGFRASQARITEIKYNGHWQSYQNPQERPRTPSRYNPEEEWRW